MSGCLGSGAKVAIGGRAQELVRGLGHLSPDDHSAHRYRADAHEPGTESVDARDCQAGPCATRRKQFMDTTVDRFAGRPPSITPPLVSSPEK
jgi:hypothetical protein